MTREEAIKILKAIRVYECYPKSASEETKEAIDMAIDALSADPVQGEWFYRWNDFECSACGAFEKNRSNFCPNCGARMDGGEEK